MLTLFSACMGPLLAAAFPLPTFLLEGSAGAADLPLTWPTPFRVALPFLMLLFLPPPPPPPPASLLTPPPSTSDFPDSVMSMTNFSFFLLLLRPLSHFLRYCGFNSASPF